MVMTEGHPKSGERWAKLSARAVVDRNLSATDVRVLSAIAIYADADGIAWPSQETVAFVIGVTRETVCRAVKCLRKHGYLDRYRKRATNGMKRNVYRLLFPPYSPLRATSGPPKCDAAITRNVIRASHAV